MKKPKIVKLNKADKVLQNVDLDEFSDIPAMVESVIEKQGYYYNRGKGPDIPDLGVEVKTRKIEATAPHTIGKMKVDDIVRKDWNNSNIYEKSQQIYRVKYSETENKITSTEMFDYRTEIVQEKLKNSYEKARQIIINAINQNETLPRYIRGEDCWGYFENTDKQRPSWYDFRLSDARVKSLDKMSKSQFGKLFREE